jgi:hypothetical protein
VGPKGSARAEYDRDALAEEPWTPLGSMPTVGPVFALGAAFDGPLLELSVRLVGYEATPTLRTVSVHWSCP